MKTIALGSDRAAKIMAVRASVARVAAIDPDWANVNVVARRRARHGHVPPRVRGRVGPVLGRLDLGALTTARRPVRAAYSPAGCSTRA